MAIYHAHISNVSRAKGSNACATASYITGQQMTCIRTGEMYDYGRKQRVLDVATHLPAGTPAEWSDPAALVNAIENFETKANARVAKKLEIALPREMSFGNQKTLLDDYCKQITKRGYACIVAIHNDNDNNNPHAHILIPNRPIVGGKFVERKRQMAYVKDDMGNRVPIIDPATGKQKLDARNRKQWKRKSIQTNPLDTKDMLLELRRSWAEECNKWLDVSERIDHRSNEERGLKTLPTIHEGYAARAMEKRGEISPICEYNREVRATNHRILEILAKIARSRERAERVQERKEQALDAAQTIASTSVKAAKDVGHAAVRWWQRTAAPALIDAIMPTPQEQGHDKQWDNYQDQKQVALLCQSINKVNEEYARQVQTKEEADWLSYCKRKELAPLEAERNKIEQRYFARNPQPQPQEQKPKEQKEKISPAEQLTQIVETLHHKVDKKYSLLLELEKWNIGVTFTENGDYMFYSPHAWRNREGDNKLFPDYDAKRDWAVPAKTLINKYGLPRTVLERFDADFTHRDLHTEQPQPVQTVKETLHTTEPKQTQQRASESHIEPSETRKHSMPDPHTHGTAASLARACAAKREQKNKEYDYDLDDVLDECERESRSLPQNRQQQQHRHRGMSR